MSYESEIEPADDKIATLKAALDEYDLVVATDPSTADWDWVRQNRGSILEPLAHLQHDRKMMDRAIDDLAADSRDGTAQADVAERIARLWGMLADIDPELARRRPGYEDTPDR